MAFEKETDIFFERVFRMDWMDDVEFDSFKKAQEAESGSIYLTMGPYVEEMLLKGIDFDNLCEMEKSRFRSTLKPENLNPPRIIL